MKLETIVAGVDFGKPSHNALSWSVHNMAPKAEYVLVHSMQLPVPSSFLGESSEQRIIADEMRASILDDAGAFQARYPGTRVQVTVPIGSAAAEIAATARRTWADLVLVGPHRSRGGVADRASSTAERVLSEANVPVLMYAGAPAGAPNRIVAAVDDSPSAGLVLEWAAYMGQRFGVPVQAFHCLDERLLSSWDNPDPGEPEVQDARAIEGATEWLIARMEDHGLPATSETAVVKVGAPAALVPEAAADDTALVVLGCHRHSLAERIFLGTVAGEVVRAARTAVLLVPVHDTD